jgi:hypothetical protein
MNEIVAGAAGPEHGVNIHPQAIVRIAANSSVYRCSMAEAALRGLEVGRNQFTTP